MCKIPTNFLRFFLLSLVFLLTVNCEKEQDQPIKEEVQTTNTLETLSIDELKSFDDFKNTLANFNADDIIYGGENTLADKSTSGIAVNTGSIIKIKKENYTSYTFAITKEDDNPETFDNLVVEKRGDTVQGFIIRYKYSEKFMEYLSLGMVLPFEGTVQRTPFQENIEELLDGLNQKINNKESKSYVCITTTIIQAYQCKSDAHWPWSTGCTRDPGDRAGYNTSSATNCHYESDIGLGPEQEVVDHISNDDFGGSGGGGVTSPNNPLVEDKTDELVAKITNKLVLFAADAEYLAENQDLLVDIANFLDLHKVGANDYTEEAKKIARMTISLEKAKANATTEMAVTTGKIENFSSLEYDRIDSDFDQGRGVLYRLKNGLFVSEYTSRRAINQGDLLNADVSLNPNGKFYYVHNPETFGVNGWHEMLLPATGVSPYSEPFLAVAFWDAMKVTARYATPLEDMIILIDGKDFDGVEASKLEAGVFLVVGFIPGGKVVKVAKTFANGAEIGRMVAKAGNKTLSVTLKQSGETFDILKNARKLAGKAIGNGVDVKGPWLRGTENQGGFFPKSVADKMRNKNYNNFDEFREDFWKNIADDPHLRSQFTDSPMNLIEMQNGRPPYTKVSQQVGDFPAAKKYTLHHNIPINQGGNVYDFDNLTIVTPRFHKDILSPAYHYGYGY